MKQLVSKAIVLTRTNYGEADRILTVITPEQGKVRLLAKGVRKIKSKMAGGIELFSISTIGYIQGRGELATLVSSRLEVHFGNIVTDMTRTQYTYQVLRVINKLTEDRVEAEYFDLLTTMLMSLNDLNIPLQVIHFWFGMQLLVLGGHEPNLATMVDGHKLVVDQTYLFDFEHMSFSTAVNGPYDASHIKLLRLARSVLEPNKLLQISNLESLLTECSRLVELLLEQQRVMIKL